MTGEIRATEETHLIRLTIGATLVISVSAVTACGDGNDPALEADRAAASQSVDTEAPVPVTEPPDTRAPVPTTEPLSTTDFGLAVVDEGDLVYLDEAEGAWTLRVASPEAEGPWPLIVIIPTMMGADRFLGTRLAALGAVVVSGHDWVHDAVWATDPNPHLYGAMDRAACIVSWAQAHAADYGADPAVTTVTGFSGGAMAATWVGLGVADDSQCDEPIAHLPVALAPEESQFLFHHERWDPAFESGDPEPQATLDGLLNPDRWNVSPELRVGLWSAAFASWETRAIGDPPGADSWIRLRDAAIPVVDDFAALGVPC